MKYKAPIYSYVFLQNCCLQDICLTIEPDTIKYVALKKKFQSKLEKTLISEIEKLESGENTFDPDILELRKQELVEFRKKELKGHMVRSRMQWLAEGEKPSRYFCTLEHNNYVDKTIKCLYKQGENYIREERKILNEIKTYYAQLYESTENIELFD